MKAIIDFDSGVYAMAAACDGRKWVYRGRQWDLKKTAEKVLISEGKDPSELRLEKDPEPWDRVEKTVYKYCDQFIEALPDPFSYTFYIKGGGNFRENIAKILPYKDGREERPYHLGAIADMVYNEYHTKRVYNVEVDDALGILADDDSILVHIDKDIEQVPGLHFNPHKGEEYTISEEEGLRRVYKQAIIGDPTDSILGLFGVGKSSKFVKALDLMDKEQDMYEHVFDMYAKRFGTYAPTFLKENMQLVWMMRAEGSPRYWWQSLLLTEEEQQFYQKPLEVMEIR